MDVRRVISLVAAVTAGTALVGTVTADAQAAPIERVAASQTPADPSGTVRALYSAAGFQELIDRVTAQVRGQYPNAQLALVDGSTPTGPTTRIDDVTTWRIAFLAVTSDRHRVVVTATVHLPSWTASISAERSPVFGLQIAQPVTMSPFQAALLARIAGYREPYTDVWFHQPPGLAPRYTFFGAGEPVTVDTATRAVTPGL